MVALIVDLWYIGQYRIKNGFTTITVSSCLLCFALPCFFEAKCYFGVSLFSSKMEQKIPQKVTPKTLLALFFLCYKNKTFFLFSVRTCRREHKVKAIYNPSSRAWKKSKSKEECIQFFFFWCQNSALHNAFSPSPHRRWTSFIRSTDLQMPLQLQSNEATHTLPAWAFHSQSVVRVGQSISNQMFCIYMFNNNKLIIL